MTPTARYVSALLAPAVIWAASSWSPALRGAPAQQVFDAGLERQAIFPVYDGYARNADGSLTLAFAYFSTQRRAGDHTARARATPSRRGRRTAVSPPRFCRDTTAGSASWSSARSSTAGCGGPCPMAARRVRPAVRCCSTTGSSPNATIGSVLRGIEDPPSAPRNVCLNRSPLVRVLGYGGGSGPHEMHVSVGAPLKLFGSVRDEGLPRSGALSSTWRVASGPGGVRFDDPARPRTTAVFDAPGTYEIELLATDSELSAATDCHRRRRSGAVRGDHQRCDPAHG